MTVTATQALDVARLLVGAGVPLTLHDGDADGHVPLPPYPAPEGYPRGCWIVTASDVPAGVLASSRVVVIEKATGRVVADGPGWDEG